VSSTRKSQPPKATKIATRPLRGTPKASSIAPADTLNDAGESMSCDLFLAPQPIIENDPKSTVSCPKAIQFNHQRQTELILAMGDDINC
jgi:hypothetical protein